MLQCYFTWSNAGWNTKARLHYRNFFCNMLKLLKQVKNFELHRRSGELATDNLSLRKPAGYWYDAARSHRNFCSVSSLLFGLVAVRVTAENLFRQCFKVFVSRQSASEIKVRQWRTDGPSVGTDGLSTTDNYKTWTLLTILMSRARMFRH